MMVGMDSFGNEMVKQGQRMDLKCVCCSFYALSLTHFPKYLSANQNLVRWECFSVLSLAVRYHKCPGGGGLNTYAYKEVSPIFLG